MTGESIRTARNRTEMGAEGYDIQRTKGERDTDRVLNVKETDIEQGMAGYEIKNKILEKLVDETKRYEGGKMEREIEGRM